MVLTRTTPWSSIKSRRLWRAKRQIWSDTTYQEEMRIYRKLMKLIHSESPLFRQPEEDLAAFYKDGDFKPPEHRYNGSKPKIAVIFDDCRARPTARNDCQPCRPPLVDFISTLAGGVGRKEGCALILRAQLLIVAPLARSG